MTRKNKFKKLLALGLGVICTFNFNVSKSLTDTNLKANLKNSTLEKNKNFSNNKKKSDNDEDNLNKYLKYLGLGLGFIGILRLAHEVISCTEDKQKTPNQNPPPFAELQQANNNCYVNAILQILYEDPEYRKYIKNLSSKIKDIPNDLSLENLKNKKDNDKKKCKELSNKVYECKLNLLKEDTNFYSSNQKQLDALTAKNIDEIGVLYGTWCVTHKISESNRVIEEFQNVVTQIPNLENSVNELVNAMKNCDNQNKEACNSTNAFRNARADRCIKHLDSVFDLMCKYNGNYIPVNERANFESSIDHVNQQRDVTEVLEYFLFDNPNLPLNRYSYLHELNMSFDAQIDTFNIDDHDNKSCIIDIGRSIPGSNRSMEKQKFEITLPEQIKNKKLKAIALHSGSTGNGGHWVAYKADDNGVWWKCDGSSVTKEFSDTKSFVNDKEIQQNVALAYYQN